MPPRTASCVLRSAGLLVVLLVVLLVAAAPDAAAQHSHINAGARTPSAGSPLFFANGPAFDADSGYLIHLLPTQDPTYGPIFFGGGAVTFTSLPTLPDNGGPSAFAALPGTRIRLIVETLEGPAGGSLSFWDSDGFFDATEITFTVPVGTRDGTSGFFLSENDGSEGADPYGHVHGRKFSATVPGLYTAGCRLVDAATNGPGQTPLHTPSASTRFQFQAGVTLAAVVVSGDAVQVRFGTQTGRTYHVEQANRLGPEARWSVVAGPIAGTGRMTSTEVLPRTSEPAFFRLRVEP